MKKFGKEVAEIALEHTALHQLDHITKSQQKKDPILKYAIKNADYGSYFKGAQLVTSHLGWGSASRLFGLASRVNIWTTVGSISLMSFFHFTPYGMLADPYSYRNRDPEPPRRRTVNFRGYSTSKPNPGSFQSYISKARAHNSLISSAYHYRSINSFTPKSSSLSIAMPTVSFQSRPYSFLNSKNFGNPFNNKFNQLGSGGSSSGMGSGMSLGIKTSLSGFSSVISSTGLSKSYNNYNPGSRIREAGKSNNSIGGVATEVALIPDLINSDTHAEADDYVLCFPVHQFPMSEKEIIQIAQELHKGYNEEKSLPFFSLHFNDDGYLYPVIHPAYSNTYIGKIIGLLDYWMKCYLNGGMFEEAFLEKWHETVNLDEVYLRSMLVDLKKYFKENVKGTPYFSLREMSSKYGLKEQNGNREYKQPYMTSFRIIAYQEGIERHQNILIPRPTFRIEYTIDMMPDYKEYIESYYRENGQYPVEYVQLERCYRDFAEEIKAKLPLLPFCKPFFQLLEVTTSLSYFYATLNAMGKTPYFPSELTHNSYMFPKALPPIPVRYHKTYPMSVLMGEVITHIQNDKSQTSFDSKLAELFDTKHITTLPMTITEQLRKSIKALMLTKLSEHIPVDSKTELNEDEVERVVQEICRHLRWQVCLLKINREKFVGLILNRMSEPQQREIKKQSALSQMTTSIKWLGERINDLDSRWEHKPELAEEEFLNELKDDFYQQRRKKFKEGMPSLLIAEIEQSNKEIENIQKVKDEVLKNLTNFYNGERQTIVDQKTQRINQLNNAINHNNQLINADTQYRNNVSGQLTNLRNQFNNLSAPLQSLNLNTYSGGVTKYNNEINRVNQHINDLNQKNALNLSEINRVNQVAQTKTTQLNQDQISNQQKVTQKATNLINKQNEKISNAREIIKYLQENPNKNTKEISGKIKNTPQEKSINYIAEIARINIKKVFEEEIKTLKELQQDILTIGQSMLAVKELSNLELCRNYVHTLIGFTNKSLADQTGDTFHIIGGCGLSLPNMQSKPIIHQDRVIEEVAKIKSFGQFSVNGQKYAAWRIPVVDSFINENELFNNEEIEIEYTPVERDNEGATVVHYAAGEFSLEDFIKVINNPAQFNERDDQGHLPIHIAARENKEEIVRHILQQDPSKSCGDAKSSTGATPLIIAVEHAHKEVVKTLVGHGVNINYRLPNGLFPLYLAIQNNHTDVALLLLEQSAILVNLHIDNGMTCLHKAIENEMDSVILKLIEKGASLDIRRKSDGFTPYHLAAQAGHPRAVLGMLSRGVAIDLPLESGKTALHLSAAKGHLPVVKLLLEKGASLNASTNKKETPLMLAIQGGHLDVAYFLANTAELNQVNQKQESAALLALKSGMPIVADRLIARGEDPLLKDNQGHDCLYYLVRNGEYQRFKQVKSKIKWDPKVKYGGNSLVAIAAERGHFMLVYALMEEGVEFITSNTMTPAVTKPTVTTTPAAAPIVAPKPTATVTPVVTKPTVTTTPTAAPTVAPKPTATVTPAVTKPTVTVIPAAAAPTSVPKSAVQRVELIHYAVMANETSYVREWLQTNKVSSGNLGDTSLAYLAAQYASDAVLDLFLKNMSTEEIEKQNLLSAALESAHQDTVTKILMKSKNLNKVLDSRGNTALHKAVMIGAIDIVALLLEQGCDPHSENHLKQTIFHQVAEQKDKNMFEMLLKKVASNDWPVDLVSIVNESGSLPMIKTLHQYPALLQKAPLWIKEEKKPVNSFKPEISPQTETAYKLIEEAKEYISEANFDLVAQIIESNPEVQSLILKDPSVNLMVHLFSNIDIVLEVFGLLTNSEKLFRTLKKIGFNPTMALGEHNVLYTLISTENEEVVKLRLSLLIAHFPNSLPALISDQVLPGISMGQLILRRGKIDLFNRLSEFMQNTVSFNGPAHEQKFFPLHEATLADNYESVQVLLKTTPVNQQNPQRVTALMIAAAHNNIRIMELLLQHGANVDLIDFDGKNALHHAISGRNLEASTFILPLIRIKNRPDREGMTPFMYAAANGLIEIVKRLCTDSSGHEQVSKRGLNALHLAASGGYQEIIAYLVNLGFPIDQPEKPTSDEKKNCLKRTALLMAAAEGHVDAVCELIKLGANTAYADANGDTVCEYAVMSNEREMLQAIQELPDFHQKNHERSLLHTASSTNNESVLNEFILDDIPLGQTDSFGRNALHLSAQHGANKAANILINSGQIDVNLPDLIGNTPLHYAACNGQVTVIMLLGKARAFINALDNQGETALFLACKHGKLGAVVKLLRLGADKALCNKEGISPIDIAKSKGYTEIVNRLSASRLPIQSHSIFKVNRQVEEPIKESVTFSH